MALLGVVALLLGAASPARADAGFDFAVERFEVSGATSFADEFDDGERDAAPTSALRDRGDTRVTEGEGFLRLTHEDGAELVGPETWKLWRDRVSLDRPIRRWEGTSEVTAAFVGVPLVPGQSAGITLRSATAAPGGAALVELSLRTSEEAATTVYMSSAVGGQAMPWDARVPTTMTCGEMGAVAGRIAVVLHAPGCRGCVLLDREDAAEGVTLRVRVLEDGSLLAGYALGTAALQPVPVQAGSLPGTFPVSFRLPVTPLVAGLFAQGPGGQSGPARGYVGLSGEDDVVRGKGDRIARLSGDLFAAHRPGRVAERPDTAAGRFTIEAAPGADVRVAPTFVRFETPRGHLLAETVRVHRHLRRDFTSGRPIVPDAPADAVCETGSEPACLSSSELRQGALALRAAAHDAAVATLPFPVGPFTGASQFAVACDATACPPLQGFDLLASDAASWLSAFTPPGTPPPSSTAPPIPQPGTIPFQRGPICTRVLSDGSVVILPGCRGPSDPGYDPLVDGPGPGGGSIGFPAGYGAGQGLPGLTDPTLPLPAPVGHPYTGEPWASASAAASWNLQMVLVSLSAPTSSRTPPAGTPSPFVDPADAWRTDGCSYLLPWACNAVEALRALAVRPLPGDPEPQPTLRFPWDGGATYLIVEATGVFAELAGGWLHSSGPVVSHVPGTVARVLFHATPPPLVDADGDDVPDGRDRCLGVANAMQRDSDGDGHGNRCDGDLDGDGRTSFADLMRFRARFLTRDPDADLDGDGFVAFSDLAILRQLWLRTPGPSAPAP